MVIQVPIPPILQNNARGHHLSIRPAINTYVAQLRSMMDRDSAATPTAAALDELEIALSTLEGLLRRGSTVSVNVPSNTLEIHGINLVGQRSLTAGYVLQEGPPCMWTGTGPIMFATVGARVAPGADVSIDLRRADGVTSLFSTPLVLPAGQLGPVSKTSQFDPNPQIVGGDSGDEIYCWAKGGLVSDVNIQIGILVKG